ncbi:MAG: hypothetical protein ABSG51_10295 [Terracidiphilus sp.]
MAFNKGKQPVSHSHIRVHPPAPKRNPWLEATVGVAFFVVVAAVYIATRMWHPFYDTDHLTAQGTVSETRIVIDHIRDSQYGGLIFYRIEALVSYEIDGQTQNRWLIASEITTERAMLASKLAGSPTTCQVYWLPGHSENARCRFQ